MCTSMTSISLLKCLKMNTKYNAFQKVFRYKMEKNQMNRKFDNCMEITSLRGMIMNLKRISLNTANLKTYIFLSHTCLLTMLKNKNTL
jgi:hypothetical protein